LCGGGKRTRACVFQSAPSVPPIIFFLTHALSISIPIPHTITGGGRAAAAAAAANPALTADLVGLIQARLDGLVGRPSGFLDDLPRPVRARVAHLKALQDKYDELEEAYQKEADELERKYEALYAPLLAARADVVTGRVDAPADVLAATPAGEGEAVEGGDDAPPAGVPRFWLGALQAHDMIAAHISEKDEAVLEHLTDISAAVLRSEPEEGEEGGEGEEAAGFKLTFTFAAGNPFFEGTSLTKVYHMSTEDEGMLEGAEGCAIAWKPGKDPTHKLMKKKVKPGAKGSKGASGGVLTKKEKVPSFFDFFSPPAIPEEDDLEEDEMEALTEALEEDYELGEAIRDELIPRAVSYFTGEMAAEEDEDEDDEDEDEDDDDGSEDDDDDSDDESEEDESSEDDGPAAKRGGGGARGGGARGGGGKGGGGGGRPGGGAGRKGPAAPPADTGEKPAECKQQ